MGRAAFVGAIAILAVSAVGAIVMKEATRYGSGLREDSFVYLSSAEGIVHGIGYGRVSADGVFRPTTKFPPLYSYATAALIAIGLSPSASARLMGAFGLSALAAICGFLVLRVTRSAMIGVIAAAIIVSSPVLIEVNTWAMAETLFLPISMLSLAMLADYLADPRKPSLIAAGVLAGLATMTRFVGLAIPLAVLPVLTLKRRGGHSSLVLLDGLTFGSLALLPIAAFLVRNALRAGELANRPPASLNPPAASVFTVVGSQIWGWVTFGGRPSSHEWISYVLIVSIVLSQIAILALSLRIHESPHAAIPDSLAFGQLSLLGSYAIAYMLALFVAMSMFDPAIQHGFSEVGSRLLAPLYVCLCLEAPILFFLAVRHGGLMRRGLSVLVALVLVCIQIRSGARKLTILRQDGQGYNSLAWRASPSMAYIRDLEQIPVYTNDLPAVYFVGRKPSTFIPMKYDPVTGELRDDYEMSLSKMRQTILKEGGVLAILGPGARGRLAPDYLADLTAGLTLVAEYADGVIYRACYDR